MHAGWLKEVLTRLAELAQRDVTVATAAEAKTFAKAALVMYALAEEEIYGREADDPHLRQSGL